MAKGFISGLSKTAAYTLPTLARSLMPSTSNYVDQIREIALDAKDLIKSSDSPDLKRTASELTGAARDKASGFMGDMKKGFKTGDFTPSGSEDDIFTDFGGVSFSEDGIDDNGEAKGELVFGSTGESTDKVKALGTAARPQTINNIITNVSSSANNGQADVNRTIGSIELSRNVNAVGFSKMHAGLSDINETLGQVVQFNAEQTSAFFNKSMLFYTSVETKLTQINSSLQKSYDYGIKKDKHLGIDILGNKGESAFSKILGDGVFNIKEYFKHLTGGFKDNVELAGMMMSDGGGNPLSMAIEALLPKKLKDSLKKIDSVAKLAPNMAAMRLNKFADTDAGELLEALGFEVGIKDGKKTKYSVGEASKGGAVFNSQTQKTIVTVIPSLLSKIVKLLDKNNTYGGKELIFDHNTGQFTNEDYIKKEMAKTKRQALTRAMDTDFGTHNFANSLLSDVKSGNSNLSSKEAQKLMEKRLGDMGGLFEFMANENKMIDFNSLDLGKFNMSGDNKKFLENFLKTSQGKNLLNAYIPELRNQLDARAQKINSFDSSQSHVHGLYASRMNDGSELGEESALSTTGRRAKKEKKENYQKIKRILNGTASPSDIAKISNNIDNIPESLAERVNVANVEREVAKDQEKKAKQSLKGKLNRTKSGVQSRYNKFTRNQYGAKDMIDEASDVMGNFADNMQDKLAGNIGDEEAIKMVQKRYGKLGRAVELAKKVGNKILDTTVKPVIDFFDNKDEDGKGRIAKAKESTINFFKDVKGFMFGKDYFDDKGNPKYNRGIFEIMKGYMVEMKDDVTQYVFGTKKVDENGDIVRQGGYLKEISNSFKEGIIEPAKAWWGFDGKERFQKTKDYFGEKTSDYKKVNQTIASRIKDANIMEKFSGAMWQIQARASVNLFGARDDDGELIRDENGKPIHGGLIQFTVDKTSAMFNKLGDFLFNRENGYLSKAIDGVERLFDLGKDQAAKFNEYMKTQIFSNLGKEVFAPYFKEMKFTLKSALDYTKEQFRGVSDDFASNFRDRTGAAISDTIQTRLIDPLRRTFGWLTKTMGKAFAAPFKKFKSFSDTLRERQAARGDTTDPAKLAKRQKRQEMYDQWIERKKAKDQKRAERAEARRVAGLSPSEKSLESIDASTKKQADDISFIANQFRKKQGRRRGRVVDNNQNVRPEGSNTSFGPELPGGGSLQLPGIGGVVPGGGTPTGATVLGNGGATSTQAIRNRAARNEADRRNRAIQEQTTRNLATTAEATSNLDRGFKKFGSWLPLAFIALKGILDKVLMGLGLKAAAGGLMDGLGGGNGRNGPNGQQGQQNGRRGIMGTIGAGLLGGAKMIGKGLWGGAKLAGRGAKAAAKGVVKGTAIGTKFLARNAGKILKFVPGVGLVAAGGLGALDGFSNADKAFGKEGEATTMGEDIAGGLGGIIDNLSFGIIDGGSAARGIHAVGSGIGSLFGMGGTEKRVTSRFGMRTSPFSGKKVFHPGTDIAMAKGTPIAPVGGGEVVRTGSDPTLGKNVEIRHKNGMTTKYGHLDSINVKQGDKVGKRTSIGRSGNTGKSTGPHVHMEAKKNGKYVNSDKLLGVGGSEGEEGGFFSKMKKSVSNFFGFGGSNDDTKRVKESAKASAPTKKGEVIGPNGENMGEWASNSAEKAKNRLTGSFKTALGTLEGLTGEGTLLSRAKNKFDKILKDTEISPIKDSLKMLVKLVAAGGGGLSTGGGDGEGGSSGGSGVGSEALTLEGKDNAEKIWNYFKGKGFSKEAVAGILGNMRQESGPNLDPKLIQNGGRGPGQGIIQWERGHADNNGRGRWNHLEDWAKSVGRDPWALDTQLDYIYKELTGDAEDPYNHHVLNTLGGLDKFKKSTDVMSALQTFEKSMERAGTPMYEKRMQYAKEYYDYLQGLGGSELEIGMPIAGMAMGGPEKPSMMAEGSTGGGSKYVKPVRDGIVITSPFGPRNLKIGSKFHKGIDYGTPNGTPIMSIMDGEVKIAKYMEGYGNVMYVDHPNGMQTRYAHLLNGGFKANVGQKVKQGQVIAASGNTGVSSGPHLHFETRRITGTAGGTTLESNSQALDPQQVLSGAISAKGVSGGDGGSDSSGGSKGNLMDSIAGAFQNIGDWFSSKIKYVNEGKDYKPGDDSLPKDARNVVLADDKGKEHLVTPNEVMKANPDAVDKPAEVTAMGKGGTEYLSSSVMNYNAKPSNRAPKFNGTVPIYNNRPGESKPNDPLMVVLQSIAATLADIRLSNAGMYEIEKNKISGDVKYENSSNPQNKNLFISPQGNQQQPTNIDSRIQAIAGGTQ